MRRADEHSSVTYGRPNASIEDGTLSRNRPQQAVAQASVLPIVADTIPQNPQAERAALPVRRREGLKPDGRDTIGGSGRSPKARRRITPTRLISELRPDNNKSLHEEAALISNLKSLGTEDGPTGADAAPTGHYRAFVLQ